jgi:hypothetical protein
MSLSKRLWPCGWTIPASLVVDGKRRNLKNRRFCLVCSPFARHNTRDLTTPEADANVKFRRWQEKARSVRRAALVAIHGGRCCACGYDRCLAALEFHHWDPGTKVFELSRGNLLKPWPGVVAEADKCDLYCANCHRELEEFLRTAMETGE